MTPASASIAAVMSTRGRSSPESSLSASAGWTMTAPHARGHVSPPRTQGNETTPTLWKMSGQVSPDGTSCQIRLRRFGSLDSISGHAAEPAMTGTSRGAEKVSPPSDDTLRNV